MDDEPAISEVNERLLKVAGTSPAIGCYFAMWAKRLKSLVSFTGSWVHPEEPPESYERFNLPVNVLPSAEYQVNWIDVQQQCGSNAGSDIL